MDSQWICSGFPIHEAEATRRRIASLSTDLWATGSFPEMQWSDRITLVLAGFLVILVILLVLFGGSKLPGLAKGLGQSIKEFKKATKDEPEPAKPAEPAAKPADSAGKPPAA